MLEIEEEEHEDESPGSPDNIADDCRYTSSGEAVGSAVLELVDMGVRVLKMSLFLS